MDAATRRTLVAVQLCFGVFPLLGKIAMPAFAPRAVLVWRLLAGAAVLLAFAWRRHGRAALPGAADLLALAGLSVLGVSLNQWLFLEGLSRSTAVNAGLVMTLIPVVTCALALALGHERPTPARVAGIALATAGVAWLFLGRGAQVSRATRTGDLLMAANCVSYSAYLVLARPVLQRLPQLVVVAWIFLWGALLVPWFCLDVPWAPDAPAAAWWALAGILLLPTVCAYLGNAVVLSRTTASTTAAYIMLQPFVAAALGVLVLGEKVGPAEGVCALAVLAGLALITRAPQRST